MAPSTPPAWAVNTRCTAAVVVRSMAATRASKAAVGSAPKTIADRRASSAKRVSAPSSCVTSKNRDRTSSSRGGSPPPASAPDSAAHQPSR